MRDLHNLHSGKTICVIGGGSSLDTLPKTHFDKHICVFVNHSVGLGFCGKVNYLVAKELTPTMQRKAVDLDAIIVTPKYKFGGSTLPNEILYPSRTIIFDAVRGSAKNKYQIGALERTASTIVTGMHLALVLGAGEVFVYGHDCCAINGQWHAKGYCKEQAQTSEDDYGAWLRDNKVKETSDEFIVLAKEVWGVPIHIS